MRYLFFIFLFSWSCLFNAQVKEEKPPTFEDRFKTSFHTKPSLDVKFDSRISFIRNTDVKTWGMKVGLNFNQRFKLGLGLNTMITASTTKIANLSETVPVNIDYFYWSPYIEYVYYTSKRWEFSLMTQIGIGEAKYSYLDEIGNRQKVAKTTILTYEPAMQIDYRIIKWVAIGTGIGYKLEFYRKGKVSENLSSPQFIIKIKVYLGKIYRTIVGKPMPIPID